METNNERLEPITINTPIPSDGFAPSQVFDRHPPKPREDKSPPAGTGLAPPPPGKDVTEADGYDAQDLTALSKVGDYRFGSILDRLPVAPIQLMDHPETEFDETALLGMLRNSISLTMEEKYKIIGAIPQMNQYQVDALMKIFEEERRKFEALSPKHLVQLQQLEQNHAHQWMEIVKRFEKQAA